MKDIWKLLMIALMALVMVGCPANNDSDEEEDGEEPDNRIAIQYPATAEVATNGIYEAKIYADGISTTDWGANSDGPTIKIIFVTTEVAQAIIDGEIGTDGELFTDENDCYVYCNNEIDNGHFEVLANDAAKDYSDVIGKGAKYEGLLVSKADAEGNYKAIVDISKIEKSQLLKKGADETTDGVESVSLTNRIPLFIGSVSFNQAKAKGISAPLAFWNAAVLFGEPSETAWPADDKIKTHDVTVLNKDVSTYQFLKGNIGDFNLTFTSGVATVDFEYTGTQAKWDAQEGDVEFGVVSDANWTDKFTGASIAALGTFYDMTYGAANNCAPKALFTVGKTYTITIEKVGEDGAKVKIAEKQGGSNPPAPTTYNITIAEVDSAEGTVTISGDTDGKAAEGTEITINATAATGKVVDTITVKDADDADVTVTGNKFTMPAKAVTITVTFKDEE